MNGSGLEDRLWLVTGCSSGLGRALAEEIIAAGRRIIVTARNPASVTDLVARAPGRVRGLALDVTDPAQIAAAARHGAEWGGVDVLVNNAGCGYLAALEEGDEATIRQLFDLNFFGLAAMTRAILPQMRAKGEGRVVNISSMVGLSAAVGSAYYAASKFAVEGLSLSLAAEVAEMGVKVMLIEPGPIRTDFADRSILRAAPLPAYAQVAGVRQRQILESNGTQSGDPARQAALIRAAAEQSRPPQHLVLGRLAMKVVLARLAEIAADIEAYRTPSLLTDFEKNAAA